ncbi:MAG: hypothetical protein KAT04_12190 [Methylococcales bacterium]|nr:hypothetical protein [Methylococcales bacterium]
MEQFDRTKRYLQRVKDIYSGIFSSSGHDKESYDDDVISFFIHCYHIRDWIIHLNKVGVSAKQVDFFINSHTALKICADLANGSKHCKLTRSLRTKKQPHIVGKTHETTTWLTGNGGGEHMKSKYSILSGENIYDALELAEESVLLWEQFIEEMKNKI